MRPLRAFITLVFVAAGVVLGALNTAPSMVDLGFVTLQTSLGVILLCTLLAGVLLGGLAIIVSAVLPLRRQLARAVATQLPGSSPPVSPSSSES